HPLQAGGEVAVEDESTRGVGMVGEGERLPMATRSARLPRVGRAHGDMSPTGPCRLVREQVRDRTPRRFMEALGETGGGRHALDRPSSTATRSQALTIWRLCWRVKSPRRAISVWALLFAPSYLSKKRST